MKPFIILRVDDVSGSSGTGRVAEGMVASDGRVVLFFADSVKLFNTVEKMMEVHSHEGRTRIHYVNQKPPAGPLAREWRPCPLPEEPGLYLIRTDPEHSGMPQSDPMVVRVAKAGDWLADWGDGETQPLAQVIHGEWTPLQLTAKPDRKSCPVCKGVGNVQCEVHFHLESDGSCSCAEAPPCEHCEP